MKLRNLFFASLAMVTFAACSNDNDPLPDPEAQVVDAGDVNISVTTEAVTKAAPRTKAEETGTDVESNVSSLKIYVFQSNGTYYSEVSASSEILQNPTTTPGSENKYGPITITGLKTNTEYTFVAVANASISTVPATLTELQNTVLTYNPTVNFVMFGKTPVNNLQPSAPRNVSLSVSRRLAAVQLESVLVDIPEETYPTFAAATAYLTDVYLVNVKENAFLGADDIEYTGDDISYLYGSKFNIDLDYTGVTNPFGNKHEQLIKTLTGEKGLALSSDPENPTTSSLGSAVRLYAFPTSSTNTEEANHPVMLKLRVQFVPAEGAEPIADPIRYYTIYLKKNGSATPDQGYGIKNNSLYKITASLTGIGSKKDNEIEKTTDAAATITVLPWQVITQNEPNLQD